MRVLVTGAYGFIGAHIVAALTAARHEVVCAVRGARKDSRFPGLKSIACDMSRDVREDVWLPRLAGIEAVVNVAGILRERGADSFAAVHEKAPMALFRACQQRGIRCVIQVSALGDPADGEFIASKHRCDDDLATLDIDWLVLRPSLVYSARGSYGGTSLLRALAGLPFLLPLPAEGDQSLQPIAAEDVGLAVVAALTPTACRREVVELVGPEVMSLRDYLLAWRRWLGFPQPRTLVVSPALVRWGAMLGEHLGKGPLGLTMARMLERGNVGSADASTRLGQCLGLAPRSLLRALAEAPSHTQDRWHARLYFLLPLMRVMAALLWIGSGVVGWLLPPTDLLAAAPSASLSPGVLLALARFAASADLVLGVLCLLRWRPPLVLSLMLMMLLGYTFFIGIMWPGLWLDPYGGLLKNLPLLAALAVLLVTEERR
ncbi:MAG: DoxX-like family protein [Rhodanobacteraceae bacterium]